MDSKVDSNSDYRAERIRLLLPAEANLPSKNLDDVGDCFVILSPRLLGKMA